LRGRKFSIAAVVISDMRMPGMNGAVLLAKVRGLYPEATRILLTGEPGRDTLVSAVNTGQIFRFLTKPCPPEELIASVQPPWNSIGSSRTSMP
jgi:DNA-binding NtrC family response regulator